MALRLKQFAVFLVLLFSMIAFAAPVTVFAQAEQCDCYCSSQNGAVSRGQTSVTNCEQRCGGSFLVCATSNGELPGENARCFTKEKCDAQNGNWDSENQPPECLPGQHYCFPSQIPEVRLSTPIGPLTQTGDFGEFVSAAYSWLLGVATTIAIVMVMIGGAQYVLSSGSENLGEAKDRIKKAIIGLVILLSAYLILFTVNPNLVKLEVPQLPMVRRTNVVLPGDSCEVFLDQGYDVDAEKLPFCGEKGEVVGGPGGTDVTEGTTCTYTTCGAASQSESVQEFAKSQFCVPGGPSPGCYSCADLIPEERNKFGVSPSSSLCRSLTPAHLDQLEENGDIRIKNYCFHSTDTTMLTAFGFTLDSELDFALNKGTCVSMQIDCRKIQTCDDYESIKVESGGGGVIGNSGVLEDLEPGVGALSSDENLKTICEANPCKSRGLNKPGLDTGCVYSAPAGFDECDPRF